MKKYFFPILLISILPGIAFGASARFTQLVREKQQKMEQLEKCMGASKGLKIAGVSTLGLTAVGVAGNIAEAKMIDSNTKTIAKNTEKIKTAQEDLDNAKLLAECKTTLTAENANANADKITSVEKDENGNCKILTCIDGFEPVDNTCQKEKLEEVEPEQSEDSDEDNEFSQCPGANQFTKNDYKGNIEKKYIPEISGTWGCKEDVCICCDSSNKSFEPFMYNQNFDKCNNCAELCAKAFIHLFLLGD